MILKADIKTHLIGDYRVIVIDNLFNWSEIEGIYVNLCNLQYKIANSNQVDVQNIQDKHLKADVSLDFLKSIDFFENGREELIEKFFEDGNYVIDKSYVNCGLKGDQHKCHVDNYYKGNGRTMLYYGNRTWDTNHGGETIFYDADKNDIAFISVYKPGRVVIFDSDMPHSARPQTFDGPNYRFTLAIKYLKQ